MVRTFVAVDLPEEMRAGIAEVAQALRGSAARLTFVAPAQIHVTLAFLGEVEPDRLGAVAAGARGRPSGPVRTRRRADRREQPVVAADHLVPVHR